MQDASCGMQRSTRRAQVTYAYKIVAGSCSGVVSSCPRNQETEQRTKCELQTTRMLPLFLANAVPRGRLLHLCKRVKEMSKRGIELSESTFKL